MIEMQAALPQEEWWGDPTASTVSLYNEEPGPIGVGHVVDHYNRYPSEVVTFYTRVMVREAATNLTLRIDIPAGLTVGDYHPPAEFAEVRPQLQLSGDGQQSQLVWSLPGKLAAGTHYEYRVEAIVAPTDQELFLTSQALVTSKQGEMLAEETVDVAIWVKGEYLRYLPSIYERDELMGRLLMLFESFLGPVDNQINGLYNYFDPRITPANFLPWLASWLDLELDERWPEARQRQLIRWAIALHRSRGTKWGLLKYLEIYTGEQAEIIERRSKNFILGAEAKLGLGVALGRGNRPHTFTVMLRLPPIWRLAIANDGRAVGFQDDLAPDVRRLQAAQRHSRQRYGR
jgi:phage tail-like protein